MRIVASAVITIGAAPLAKVFASRMGAMYNFYVRAASFGSRLNIHAECLKMPSDEAPLAPTTTVGGKSLEE
jgi:hypothetical protein